MSAEIVEGAVTPKPKSKKMLLIAGGAGALLLLGGGGTGYMLMAGGTSESGDHASAKAGDHGGGGDGGHGGGGGHGESGGSSYVDVPAMVVNLRSPDGAPRFLKLHFMLVPGPHADTASLTDQLPAILDAYQPFLRELRPEDLAGSAAVYRIKEEMLVRANEVAGDGAVADILIQDLIQQ